MTNSAGPADVRILILEDEAWDAEFAQRLLTGAGVRFRAAVVGTLTSFEEQLTAFGPDVIVADYSLPGFSGGDALAVAREQCPHIPFIFWSGVLGDEQAVELIKAGATDYVLKDRPARLPSAVVRAIEEARQRARLAQVEAELSQAQHLASRGQLVAAKDTVSRVREVLATLRAELTDAEPAAGPAAAAAGPAAAAAGLITEPAADSADQVAELPPDAR